MCTVTYLPTTTGYIISSNRDESPLRSHTPLLEEKIGRFRVKFPRDTKGGSWIFSDDKGRTLVVLNGAFVSHQHRPPYRESRGLIAKQFFLYSDAISFIKNLDLSGIEPFTMIIYDGKNFLEFRWDEDVKHVSKKDPSMPHIWSSSTLYSPEIQELRRRWFFNYLKNSSTLHDLEQASYIHNNGNVGDPEQNYIMNRGDIVCTVSITHVKVDSEGVQFFFKSLL